MNWFDYTLIVIVSLSVLASFFRGFVREAVSLAVWAVGLFLAFKFAPILEQYIRHYTHWQAASYVAAFFVIFLCVWIVGLLLGLIIRLLTSAAGLGFADRLLGVAFGTARGVLVVAVLLMFISLSPYHSLPAVQTSMIAPHFHGVVVMLNNYVPRDMQNLSHWAMGGV